MKYILDILSIRIENSWCVSLWCKLQHKIPLFAISLYWKSRFLVIWWYAYMWNSTKIIKYIVTCIPNTLRIFKLELVFTFFKVCIITAPLYYDTKLWMFNYIFPPEEIIQYWAQDLCIQLPHCIWASFGVVKYYSCLGWAVSNCYHWGH